MIYTIGHKQSYLLAIANSAEGKIYKVGRRQPSADYPDGYEGGYALETKEDAERLIEQNYKNQGYVVFGLQADWAKGAIPADDGWWRNLKSDAEIVVCL